MLLISGLSSLSFIRSARFLGGKKTFLQARSISNFRVSRFDRLKVNESGCIIPRRFYAAKDLPEHLVIKMPALSPTMTSGSLGEWHKKVGDEIVAGDVLVEIETDKAQMDFECQDEGFLAKVLMESGSKDVPVNTPIAVFVENKEDAEKFANVTAADFAEAESVPPPSGDTVPNDSAPVSKASSVPSQAPPSSTSRVFASPVAKKIASEKGIDIGSVPPTGPNNRVVKADVEGFSPAAAPAKATASAPMSIEPIAGASYEDMELSNMRKVIASRLQESKSSIPHYYLTVEIVMDKVLKLREVFNEQSKGQYKLSVNDFLVKSAALALKQVPEVNSQWMGSFIRKYNTVDISVAVSTPSGLITPIVKNADLKGLVSISDNIKDLAKRGRDNKLAPEEYQGGTFTISNLGMFGIKEFTAIINPPQSCILAVGATENKMVPDSNKESGFAVVQTMNVTMSCDHRVVDGAVGAKWLAKFKENVENPLTLML